MKKLLKTAAVLLLFFLLFLLLPPVFHLLTPPEDPVLASLPKFQSREFYSCNGFQDTTDYAKYAYQLTESAFMESPYFREVTQPEIPQIVSYIEDFENWVETCSDFPEESYDFSQSVITEGDFFYIHNRYEEPEKAFWNYNVYYFDIDSQTLFYFHNNI